MTLSQEAPNPSQPHILSKYNIGQNLSTFRTDLCHLSDQVGRGELALEDALEVNTIVMEGEFVNIKPIYADDKKTTVSFVLDPDFLVWFPSCWTKFVSQPQVVRGVIPMPPSRMTAWPRKTKDFADLLAWATGVHDLAAEWWMRTFDRLRAGTTFGTIMGMSGFL